MTSPVSWNVLANAACDELTLAADFSATGRTIGTFSDLASRLGPDHALWETALPPVGTEAGMTGPDHVERWLLDVGERRPTVRAVLGFCAGSVFAAAIAEGVAQWQDDPPTLILLDPQRPDRDVLHHQYQKLVGGRLAAVMAPDEVEAAKQAGMDAKSGTVAMADLAACLTTLVAEVGAPAFERTGLNAERSKEFVDTFNSYLRYLAAAGDIDPAGAWARATAISSETADCGLRVLPAHCRASTVAREIELAVPYNDLLRSDETARVVGRLLASPKS